MLKALEKDRGRRYATANGLARDLERYLADELVETCPPSAGYRLKKFARKHRKALATAAAFVVLLLVGITGLALSLVAIQRAKDRTEVALGHESQARQRAQQALDAMSSQVVEDWLSKRAHLEPAQQAFLQKALAWYEELAQETGDALETREAAANAYYRIGSIHLTLGPGGRGGTSLRQGDCRLGTGLRAIVTGRPVRRATAARAMLGQGWEGR